MQEDLPYRSPVKGGLKNEQPQSSDERDLPTLVQVRDILNEFVNGLSSNFSVFNTNLTSEQLHIQIKARQEAHNLVEPLSQAVNTVVEKLYAQKRGQ